MLLLPCLLSFLAFPQGDGPLEFGRARVRQALERAGLAQREVAIEVGGRGGAESFELAPRDGALVVTGADPAGAMYGAFEAAERIERLGARAWDEPTLAAQPYLADRGLNVFLTLPWDSDKNEPIYDPAALNDPARWWFQDDDYWRTLFDLMAEARLNWLDLHGAYDIQITSFPNLYAYFVESLSFPAVGVAKAVKDKDLAQLARVIELAHARGIRVGMMAYEAQFGVPHNPKPGYDSSEANLYQYTREVVEATIRALPALDAIGFRIGESGHGAEFFNCYLEAVKASGRDIPLYTRSWITRKRVVVPLARASNDFTVEIKYNGEQWGPPYLIAGGRVPGWASYSFEDYLSDSNVDSAARMWPGNLAEPAAPAGNREPWPDEPYKIVWQVRANGTHRIFPFYEPDWVRRTIGCMKIGTASGYTVEPLNAYYPATPRYYLADPKDQWCDWIHQRDAIYLIQWGRLGYAPKTPESVFEEQLERHYGKEVRALAPQWKAASRVVPTAFTAFSFGPDHRDHAPELEWGGSTEDFIQAEPFDSHVFKSIKEELAYQATGGVDGRLSLRHAGSILIHGGDPLQELVAGQPATKRARGPLRELASAWQKQYSLSEYYAYRFGAAWYLASAEATTPESAAAVDGARGLLELARATWQLLDSGDGDFYKPFVDRLRMRTTHFRWGQENDAVQKERDRFGPQSPNAAFTSLPSIRSGDLEFDPPLDVRVEGNEVVVGVRGAERAWLLAKPLPSSTFFHRSPMTPNGDRLEARFERKSWGHEIAAELMTGDVVRRTPFWSNRTPYVVVPSLTGPTPSIYSSQEALTFLRPDSLDPAKHGLLLIATRAWDFHRDFDVATQRKLLDAVARGMTLLVLQQDYASGRYSREWFPYRPEIANAPANVFDPGGALGLEEVETADVLWQPIRPSEGWTVFGNGGIARSQYGKGEIWLCQARLMQRMYVPGCARNLLKLLELGGREKPVVIVDAGSEGNRFSTSVFPDFMNAHDIPFLTLGEVIAAEQGPDSTAPVSGHASTDRVLEGRGAQEVEDLLARKMRAACSRPVPATAAEFEVERARRKREFLRSIGLDPLPLRTPLNARVVGTLDRPGYTIEKVVFESRPNFPVTAHVYKPKGRDGEKLPVIVNANGHWSHKKGEPVVQERLIAQALHGYLAMIVDSAGSAFEENARIERRGAGSHFDPKLRLGSTTADTIYVWDLMRALDYLETRPDADTSRAGITGTSGGGHATLSTFAADERFVCAVPVCYATSFLDGWENGCDCNHIPGYVQVGDRADVLAIRVPSPILVIGARTDDEFPPAGTQHTGEKLRAIWKLFGEEDRAGWQVFDGEHGYSKPMREAALGFFDRYLKGQGDGSPVSEPELHTTDPEADELFCLPDPPQHQTTMREIARGVAARETSGGWADFVALNGGAPESAPLDTQRLGVDPVSGSQMVTFQSEAGFLVPGLLRRPQSCIGGVVLVDEDGKLAAERDFPVQALNDAGIATLAIDARGTGELAGLDPKLMAYLGTSQAFAMGWDAARAAAVLLEFTPRVAVVGRGAAASQAALCAGHFEPRIGLVVGLDVLQRWDDAFADDVPLAAVQPRAGYAPSLERLRAVLRRPVEWYPRESVKLDLAALLEASLRR